MSASPDLSALPVADAARSLPPAARLNLVALFWAELRREWILVFRYPLELVSRLIWNLGFALMIYYGFNAIGSGGGQALPGFQDGQMGRLLGMLVTYIAMNGLNNAVELINQETQTGTLEQAALSPPPLWVILVMRDLASYVEMILRFALVLGIATLVTGVRFHLDVPALFVILTLMYLGLEGIGLILGGGALLYKRVGTLTQFAAMLVFGLSILPLEGLPGWMKGFVDVFPFTQALVLMRRSAVSGETLATMTAQGTLPALALTAGVYLAIGLVLFARMERVARDRGTLNQY